MSSMPPLKPVKPGERPLVRRRDLRIALLILLGSIVLRVVSFIVLQWGRWSLVDYLSIACVCVATWLAWSACITVVRDTEIDLRKCHDDMEATWQQRHDALLAREREILRKMDEVCTDLGIDTKAPEPEPVPERPALYVAWDRTKQDAG